MRIPARHNRRETLRLPDDALCALVRDALQSLHWKVTHDADGSFRARVKVNMWSWGEHVRVTVRDGVVDVESRCALPTQFIDWGRNARNVAALFAMLPPPVLLALDAARGGGGAPMAVGTLAPGTRRGNDT